MTMLGHGPRTLDKRMLAYVDGSETAFGELYAALEPSVRRKVALIIRSTADLDDLVQAAFMRAHVARARYCADEGYKGGVVAWYLAIARNTALDYLRRRNRANSRHHRLRNFLESADPATRGETETPEVVRIKHEVRVEREEQVHDALAALSTKDRELLIEHKLHGRPLQDIAVNMGLLPVTVRVRAHRAYKRFGVVLAM